MTDEEQTQEPTVPASPARLSDEDRLALAMAEMNKRLATANAEKAIAQKDTNDINYKYVILQLYMRYHLTEEDSIDENGNIIKGGIA